MPSKAPEDPPKNQQNDHSNSLTLTGLERGTDFGARYRIMEMLGQGGMGVVYRARDRELNRDVALKLIKPSISERPNALERFKREILLASKVTHKNVLRIYDLGDVEGIKYVSMAFIEGEDLGRLIRREGALPPDRAARILKQILIGLKAAHDEGVLHRDLKPQNILLDEHDNVYITDFGLARTLESTGEESLTGTGEVVGTPMYLSPEQIRGEKTDQRTDLYSVGLINYQMLTGQTPFEAVSGFRWILQRMDSSPKDPGDITANIPKYLRDITRKCTESNPDLRYQTAAEVLLDIDSQRAAWKPSRSIPSLILKKATFAAVVLLVLFAAAYWFSRTPRTESAPVALAVLPFINADSNEPDWKGTAVMDLMIQQLSESKMRVVSGRRIFQVLKAITADNVNEIQQVTAATDVLTGKYSESNGTIRIQAKLQNRNEVIQSEDNELMRAVQKLTEQLQDKFNVGKPNHQMIAFSPEQLQLYYRARFLEFQGKTAEAALQYESIVKKDSGFALAASTLARIRFEDGDQEASAKYAQLALQARTKLPATEQYRVEAIQARIAEDKQKTEQTYARLIEQLPADPELYSEIGSYFYEQEDWNRALQYYRKAYEFDPKSVYILTALGRTELRNANPQTALKYLTEAQMLSKHFENDKEYGALLNMLGSAYRLIGYQDSALEHYQKAYSIRNRIADKSGMSDTLGNIAIVYKNWGKYDESLRHYHQALKIAQDSGDEGRTGRFLNNLGSLAEKFGQFEDALKYYNEGLAVARSVGSKSEITNRLSNIGWIYYLQGRYTDAITYFDLALQEIGESDRMLKAPILLYLGNVWADLGKYDAALDSFSSAIKIWRQSQYQSGLGFTLIDAAHTLNVLGSFESGNKYLQEAERIAGETDDKELSAQLLLRRCEAMRLQKDFKHAGTIIKETLQMAKESGNRSFLVMAKVEVAGAYNDLKVHDQAIPLLEETVKETEALQMWPLLARARLELGRAYLLKGQKEQAFQQFAVAAKTANQLGLQEVLLQANFLYARTLQQEGKDNYALNHYKQALAAAEQIRKHAGDHSRYFLKRSDVIALLRSAKQCYQATGKESQFLSDAKSFLSS